MVVRFLLLILLTGFTLTKATTGHSHPSPKHDMISFHYMTPVSKTEFRTPGSVSLLQTFTPTTPGSYTFVNDIGYQGTSTSTVIGGNTAAFIQSDNIVIDLGGKTLYQNNATANMNGIEINTNQKNITIKNGSIVGFTGAGIYAHSGCNNIRIQDVVITGCGKQGIYFAGTNVSGTDVNNCVIQNSIVSKTTGITTTNNGVALELDYCQNIFVYNSLFGHSDARTASMDSVGVLIQNGINIVFDHCDASANKGQNAYGFKITGTDGGCSACSFYECTAQNNSGSSTTGGSGYGFYTNIANSFMWENCIAANNSGTKDGFGFYLSAALYSSFVGCESNYNVAGTLATAATDGGRGFYTTGGIGNTFTRCVATGNQGNTTNATTMGIGFDLQTENYAVINDCEARANGSDTSVAWGVGVNLANCSQTIIKNSRLFNNRSTTLAQAYGIQDSATSSTSLITDCFFFGNGQGTNYSNYSITYPGQGELNLTAAAPVGGMGGISYVKPFQNITVTPS